MTQSLIKNPLFWLVVLFTILLFSNNSQQGKFLSVLSSDGRGYYAYLPALFIYNDPSFLEPQKVEKQYTNASDQYYLMKDDEGKIHNKYFPGVAILQAPFFGMACGVSWLFNHDVNGYSSVFQLFILIGTWSYTLLGLYFFYKTLSLLFPKHEKKLPWLITGFYLSTPLLFYPVFKPSFTHHLSFFLFCLFAFLIVKIKTEITSKLVLTLGMTLGLITLVRPTNIIVVVLIPFLLEDSKSLKSIWYELLQSYGKKIWIGLAGFFSVVFLMLLIWKWQSGQWFVWSYSGEGFNWRNPKFVDTLFSFRIGLFLHSPIYLLSILGTFILFRKSKFQFAFWWIYFLLNTFIISSWWCWDYESSFGNRPYTEHAIFLLIPLFYLFDAYKKWIWSALIATSLLGIYRFGQYSSGANTNQRFTASSYFKSLQFWKNYPFARFNYTLSPEVFGNKMNEKVLLDFQTEKEIKPQEEFPLGGESNLELPRTYERFGYRIELDKKIETNYLEGVHLVVDASNEDLSERYYVATELHNDRYEGKGEWKHLVFEGNIPDNLQKFDRVKIYIWNQNHRHLWVKNVKITLSKYLAE